MLLPRSLYIKSSPAPTVAHTVTLPGCRAVTLPTKGSQRGDRVSTVDMRVSLDIFLRRHLSQEPKTRKTGPEVLFWGMVCEAVRPLDGQMVKFGDSLKCEQN